MTRTSIREYAAVMRRRYQGASKKAKGAILDEFCWTAGYHRKAAIRLLRHPHHSTPPRKGANRKYGPAVAQSLKVVWEATDRACSKRLKPFIPEVLAALERHGEITLEPEVREKLLRASPSTIDRLLEPYRVPYKRRPHIHSDSLASIRDQVPIRTFGEWRHTRAGSLQCDLVAHCGESTEGFYLNSLVGVDVKTSWTVSQVIWGRTQQKVVGGLERIRRQMPFKVHQLHTDNGGEFLNRLVLPWCQQHSIRLSRGRPYKKNDQAYVEQKNGSLVRRWVGYGRYSTKAAYEQMQKLYWLVSLYINFFQPVSKVVMKERSGAKVKKTYDEAQTPYQRLLAAGVLDEGQRKSLEQLYRSLNPVKLLADIYAARSALWRLADRRDTVRYFDDQVEQDAAGG